MTLRKLLAGTAAAALLAFAPVAVAPVAVVTVGLTALPGAALAQTPQQTDDARLFAFMEEVFQGFVQRNPELRTQIGLPGPHDSWTPRSDAFAQAETAIAKEQLARLQKEFATDGLSVQGRLNRALMAYVLETAVEAAAFQYDGYAFTRLDGAHTGMPSLLISAHAVRTARDAEDYIARLRRMGGVLDEMLAAYRLRADRGIVLPAFNYAPIAEASRAVVTGRPFDDGPADAPLYADFKAKVAGLDIPEADKQALIAKAEAALTESVGPDYRRFADTIEAAGKGLTANDGVWALPRGAELYELAIRQNTTVQGLTADGIHALGLKEVARIQDEMRAIMRQVKFAGDLQAFFTFLKTDPRFYYPDTDEGRGKYLVEAKATIDRMEAQLDKYFGVKPKARLEVKPVEAFRENSAPGAFYEPPALDGSRPGYYYANMSDMKGLPIFDLETLAYHEGIPGHHMQIAIAQELQGIPTLRRVWNTSAYAEGWALYSEFLGKEMGFFTDPYSDAGRLAAELFRAVRLVVDTGLHAKKWTREQAIQYMNDNTPNAEIDNTREVERYINWPGQALSYKIGMLEIQRMRAEAMAALGDRFDIRGFHDTILANGAVPLPILDGLVKDWVATRKGG